MAGVYCLVGVREVGSCMRLSPGGKFEYYLSYGAYDESSEGTWKLGKGEIVVDTPAYDKRATFSFKRMQKGDAFHVIVESAQGRGIAGIDVAVTCDGTSRNAGYTQTYGLKVDCATAPTAVALALPMFNVPPQTIDVAGRAGADKVYVFAFDPGDLGKKPFAGQRLRIATDDALVMMSDDTPIPELKGRPLRYERRR